MTWPSSPRRLENTDAGVPSSFVSHRRDSVAPHQGKIDPIRYDAQ